MRRLLCIVGALCLTFGSLAAQTIKKNGLFMKVQTDFSAEDDVKTPTKIPRSILRQIRREFDGMPGQDEFMRQLEASFIFLNNGQKPELLVQGPLGANVTTFRLYRQIGHQWRQVLTTVAHDLRIQRKSHNGYRNIWTACMTAVTVSEATYKFNGRSYVATKCSEETIGRPKSRKHFRCS